MSEISWIKVQGHVCPTCGGVVLRGTTTRDDHGRAVPTTTGYRCAQQCGWAITGASLPVH